MDNEEFLSYIKRAFELKEQESYKQAIEMFYKALSIEPDNEEILYQLGELYLRMKNYARAIQYPEQILSDDECNIRALKLLADIYFAQNNIYAAKETAEKIYSLEPAEDSLLVLIKANGKLNMLENLEDYKAEIKNSGKCLYECANYYRLNMDLANAEEYINLALEKDAENSDYKILKGEILFDKGEFQQAEMLFNNFDKNSTNPKVLNYQGLFYMEKEDFIEAIKCFSKAVSIDKKESKYYFNLGNAYFLNGWIEESVAAYKNAINCSPDNVEYRYSLAYLYYKNGDYDKAKVEVELILSVKPDHSGANVIKALLLTEKENYIEAEKILLRNVENGCEDEFTLSAIAKTEKELSKYNQAKNYINKILQKNPNNLSVLCDLLEIYIKEKSYTDAVKLADKITDINENYLEGYILGAMAAYEAGDNEKLKIFAQNILAIDMNCADGYFYLSLARKQEEDFDEAIECLKRAIICDANNAKYYAQMADLYNSKGDIKTAFDYVKEAENIDDSEEYKVLYKQYAAKNRK